MPERMAAGAFIMNSGLTKLAAEQEQAERVHGMAKDAYPFLENLEAGQFTKLLGLFETALGATLLLPFVGDGAAGLALATFSGGLLGLYATTPGMRREGSLRPSQQGIPLAKDLWLFGMGVSLAADSVFTRARRRKRAKHRD